ncbi:hypothetical protein ACS0TY_028018 [Phlomoides rotata]
MTNRRRSNRVIIPSDAQQKKKKARPSEKGEKGKPTKGESGPTHMEVEDDVVTSETPNTQSSRTSRGPTHMHRLAMLKNNEKKLVVFNDRGQPTGTNGTEMQSYIGVLARRNIKIAYREWKDVPMNDKETIWEGVNEKFIVDQSWKKSCLVSANNKWRQFKAMLTTIVYSRVKQDLDAHDMNTPPSLYHFIAKDDWTDFVFTRMSDDFKELSEKQKCIRAQNKYPHRLSRKGYANYAVENNDYIDQKKSGSQFYGVKDGILAKALDSKEHAGRVRGVGGDVTPSTFFRKPKLNSGLLERIEKLESTVYKTRASNSTVEKADESPIEKGSYSVHFDGVVQDDEEDLKDAGDEEDLKAAGDEEDLKVAGDEQDLKVVGEEDLKAADEEDLKAGKLVTLKTTKDTVAYGTIIKTYTPNEMIHGIKLPKKSMRVSIDAVVDANAFLPFQTSECKTVQDAIGSHVAWPVHLINLQIQVNIILKIFNFKASQVSPNKKPNDHLTAQNVQKQGNKKCRKEKTLGHSRMPGKLYMLYCYAKVALSERVIRIIMDKDVFGRELKIPIHFEDIDVFCRLHPISYSCIVVYIWHLYNKFKHKNFEKFKFVDPYGVGHVPSTNNEQTFIDAQISRRARVLTNRLVGTPANQLCVVPCNTGGHWILTIINPHKDEICLFDPLNEGIANDAWKDVVDMALKMFNAETMANKPKKRASIWKVIKVPKQPDLKQCGFFVLRYMRCIFEFEGSVDMDSMQSLFTEKTYSRDLIDEMRVEWAECIQHEIN